MDLLITVLTLIAAVLAITPRERQLDIRVRVRNFDWLVIITSALLVIGLGSFVSFVSFVEFSGVQEFRGQEFREGFRTDEVTPL